MPLASVPAARPDTDNWFVRLESTDDAYIGDAKVFGISALSGFNKVPTKEGKPVKPAGLIHGGIVLGRKSTIPRDNHALGYFTSPILSRAHAHLTITTNGHVYITDLGSLHGTFVAPSHAAVTPMKLEAFRPVQLLEKDTIILGKGVYADKKEYSPLKFRVEFRYPELGQGSSMGERKCLGEVSPSKAVGQFATHKDRPHIWKAIMGTQTYMAEKNVPDGETHDLGTIYKYGVPAWMRYSSEEPETTSKNYDSVKDNDDDDFISLTKSEAENDTKSFRPAKVSASTKYSTPRSVLSSNDDEEWPRGSSAEYQSDEESGTGDEIIDDASYTDCEDDYDVTDGADGADAGHDDGPEILGVKEKDHVASRSVSPWLRPPSEEADVYAHQEDDHITSWSYNKDSEEYIEANEYDVNVWDGEANDDECSASEHEDQKDFEKNENPYLAREDTEWNQSPAARHSPAPYTALSLSACYPFSPSPERDVFTRDAPFSQAVLQQEHREVTPAEQDEGGEPDMGKEPVDAIFSPQVAPDLLDSISIFETGAAETETPAGDMARFGAYDEHPLEGYSSEKEEEDEEEEEEDDEDEDDEEDEDEDEDEEDEGTDEEMESEDERDEAEMSDCEQEQEAQQSGTTHIAAEDLVFLDSVPLPLNVVLEDVQALLTTLESPVVESEVPEDQPKDHEQSTADAAVQTNTRADTPSCHSASEEEIVTPPVSRKRSLPIEFTEATADADADADIDVDVKLSTSALHSPFKVAKTASKDGEPAAKRQKNGLASSIGLMAIGAALGSIGTIAGLMQLAD